jgi:EAL domain-containing protein (putative c-di-GMP-specific phosphodiesterase class I)
MGCDFGQGFFFSRPLTAERLEGLLESGALWLLETQVH